MEPNSPRAERAVNTPYNISFAEEAKRTSTGRRGDQYWSLIATRTGHTSKQYWSARRSVLVDFLPSESLDYETLQRGAKYPYPSALLPLPKSLTYKQKERILILSKFYSRNE